MPNFTLIRELATALRSGKYPQTTKVLRSEHGYCCLGVACDLVDPTAWMVLSESDSGHVFYYGSLRDGTPGDEILPPPRVIDQYGVNLNFIPDILCAEGKWNYELFGEAQKLSAMNDDGASFAHIANILDFYCDIYDTEHTKTA